MMRTTIVAAVALVALVAAGGVAVADGVATQESEEVSVELVVTTPDGDPIDGAEATVEWDGGSVTETTSSNGRVYVDVPVGADASIALAHDEYVQNVAHEITDVSERTVETAMYSPATGEITVVARGDTDADGVFTSDEIEEGVYEVSVDQPGYYDAEATVDLAAEPNETIEIESGEVTVDLLANDPTPEGPGQVSADVEIALDGDHVFSATPSDGESQSVFLDVNRNYDVTVSKANYSNHSTGLRTSESDGEATFNITREPAISLSTDNQRVVVGETLRVEVTDEYDRPVENATVSAGGEGAGQTDADGIARVEISSDGDVDVGAEYDGLSADPVTITGVASSSDGNGSGDAGDGDGNGDSSDGDGGTGDGSPGFGVGVALVGVLAAVAVLGRRD